MVGLPAIALVLSFTGGMWLDVPFVRQAKEDCGPASIWMLMQYWKSPTPPVQEIHRAIFSNEAAGVYAHDMEKYLASSGFQTASFSGEWSDIRENLLKGRPLIVALRGSPLHYVVVAGIDDDQNVLFVNDAASRKLRAMRRADFEKRWLATNNWALVATRPYVETETTTPPFRGTPPSKARDFVVETVPASFLEKASSAFRRDDYAEAKRLAKLAEKADRRNSTTNDLLATLYLLDDNVEAALKYWNRTGQPVIRNIPIEPPPKVDPVTLDRAFTFSRASKLTVTDFLATKRRLDQTRIFSAYAFDLLPVDDNRFDVTLRGADASGAHYLGWLEGLPYQTVRPGVTNIGKRTVNLQSLVRWDIEKRRAAVSADGPLADSESARFAFSVDARDERWISRGQEFAVKRVDAALGVKFVRGGRETLETGLTVGTGRIGYRTGLEYDLIRWPEHRLVISGGLRALVGRNRGSRFAKGEPAIRMHWLPQARGSDFETLVQLRAGRASTATPVDELFILGLDRDTDLLLRAHSALSDGRRGAGPIGNRYVLLNAQTAKVLHDFGIARISAGPFIDVARMSQAFVDAGLFLNLSVGPTLKVSFSVGRDLRSGHTMGFFN